MSTSLQFRSGSKLGRNFQVKQASGGTVQRDGAARLGVIAEWTAVAVRSVKKKNWQDVAGNWRDSVYFYELAPADEESEIKFDEYYIRGRFKVVRQETDAQRARDAWHAFVPR
jgi:hypothetical protein